MAVPRDDKGKEMIHATVCHRVGGSLTSDSDIKDISNLVLTCLTLSISYRANPGNIP